MHLRPSDAELGLLMSMDASQVLLHLILLLLLSLPFTSTCHHIGVLPSIRRVKRTDSMERSMKIISRTP